MKVAQVSGPDGLAAAWKNARADSAIGLHPSLLDVRMTHPIAHVIRAQVAVYFKLAVDHAACRLACQGDCVVCVCVMGVNSVCVVRFISSADFKDALR